jgi:hypothetical protein
MIKICQIFLLLFLLHLLPGVDSLCAQERYKTKFKDGRQLPITGFSFQELYGGVIVIRATLDNMTDSLQFVLDTGSGGISIDSTTALKYGITTVESDRTIRGIAGVKPVKFAYNHTLHLPGLTIDSLDFHINDYEMLSATYGVQIDGIIGYSFFKKFIVAVDFDNDILLVYPPGSFEYPRGGEILRPAIASIPMQFAVVHESRDVTGRYFFDTGAGLCLLLNNQFATDSTIFAPGKKMVTTIAEGIGGKKEMTITVLKRFKLGKYKFKKMPTYIFDDEFNITSYPFLSGLIGNDLLRRFNMVINYSKSEIHLKPNKGFREPFDYTYTGFNMYQIDGDVYLTDVMENSSAYEVGLKEGDIIISMGNRFGGNLQQYKNTIKNPGGKMKIVVLRAGELIEFKFGIETIKQKRKSIFR